MATDYEKTESGLSEIADSIRYAALHLGVNDDLTPFGALEVLAVQTKEGSERIADALMAVASALDGIAASLTKRKE